jgi:hypothetical protein
MLTWLARRRLRAFEKAFNYDASYAHEMAEVHFDALLALNRATALGRLQGDLPSDAFYAAKLVGYRHFDCGPCLQLAVDMACAAGVSTSTVKAVLSRNWSELPEHVALSAQFACASLERLPEADTLRELVVERFGKKGLISLSTAIAASGIYPTLKYALGYGRTCQRTSVGDHTVHPSPRPAILEAKAS